MAKVTIINKFGRIVGWNNITLNMYGRDMEGIVGINYDDNQTKANEYGAGKYPIGQSEGNYEAKCSIELYKEEILALQEKLPVGVRIQDIPPTDLTVQYEYKGFVKKDVIRNFSIVSNGVEVKQQDGKIVHKHECLCSHIDWNVR